MKSVYLAGGLALSLCFLTRVLAKAEDTTRIRNGSNRATVSENGEAADKRSAIETSPGYIRIEQHNRNNRAVIIQDNGSRGRDPLPDDSD